MGGGANSEHPWGGGTYKLSPTPKIARTGWVRISASAKIKWGGFLLCLLPNCTKDQQDRMAYNGTRVYEPVARARQLRKQLT